MVQPDSLPPLPLSPPTVSAFPAQVLGRAPSSSDPTHQAGARQCAARGTGHAADAGEIWCQGLGVWRAIRSRAEGDEGVEVQAHEGQSLLHSPAELRITTLQSEVHPGPPISLSSGPAWGVWTPQTMGLGPLPLWRPVANLVLLAGSELGVPMTPVSRGPGRKLPAVRDCSAGPHPEGCGGSRGPPECRCYLSLWHLGVSLSDGRYSTPRNALNLCRQDG